MWIMTPRKFEGAGDDGAASGGAGAGAGAAGSGDGGAAGGSVDTGGSAALDLSKWKEALPEDLRNEPTIAQTKDIVSLAKQLVDAQKMIGGSVRMPGPDAKPEDLKEFISKARQRIPNLAVVPQADAPAEEWEAYYKAVGRPDDPTGYELPAYQSMTGDEFDDSEWAAQFQKAAWEAGLSPQQAERLYQLRLEEIKQAEEAFENSKREAIKVLQQEYGDQWEEVVEKGHRVAKAIADEDFMELMSTALGNHPAVVKFFAKLGDMIDEPGVFREGTTAAASNISPEEATQRIMEIRNNPDHPYNNPKAAGHQEAVEYMNYLYRVKNGEA